MKRTLKLFTATVLLLIAFSCKKNEVGPQGPQGAQGAQGNANVQTTTIKINANDWVAIVTNYQYAKTINLSAITQGIIDNGSVVVYQSTDGASWGAPSNPRYVYSLGKVDFIYNLNNTSPNMDYYFKIVVIAGQ